MEINISRGDISGCLKMYKPMTQNPTNRHFSITKSANDKYSSLTVNSNVNDVWPAKMIKSF